MDDVIARLRGLVDAATEGPWRHQKPRGVGKGLAGFSNGFVVWPFDGQYGGAEVESDAEFIATFDPVTVAVMLDVIEAAEVVAKGPHPVQLQDALARFREVAG